jgi:hypothetical protein
MTFPVFSAGEVLRAQDMNAVGLWKVASVSVTSGNVISVSNCFTSDYTNYRIVISNLKSTSNVSLTMQLQASGSPSSAGYQYGHAFILFGTPSWNLVSTTSASTWVAPGNTNTNPPSNGSIDIYQPQVNQRTGMIAHYQSFDAAIFSSGAHNDGSNVYDGFRFTSAGTFSSGTVTVYGYTK